ncbi:hypothetical protein ABW20_dc0105743 [Dactylellina cionopaga]|nr:hypothetical protein ABW20_dc0105743 [Dactylellina cionopaga]
MEEVGLDARIIKVASLGLDERWLGKNVADYQTRMALENLKRKWGSGNVAGEGGEFETLVMGCKGWAKRVEVKSSETVDEGNEVAWTRFLETNVVDVSNPGYLSQLPKPPILDGEFQKILNELKPGVASEKNRPDEKPTSPPTIFQTLIQTSPHHAYISNLHGSSGNVEEQVHSIFSQLRDYLQMASSSERQITSTLLLLRSMADFPIVNKIYSPYFSTFPNPPSRVCIAIGDAMPTGIDVLLSVMVDKPAENDRRKALHVQSRSYWAPANVGPYSQAIATGGIVSVAGMIGLVPESMKVWDAEGVKGETALALQSLIRVGREMNIHGKEGWLGGVGYAVDPSYVEILKNVWEGWFAKERGDEGLQEDETASGDDPEVPLSYFERTDQDITPPTWLSAPIGLPGESWEEK